MSLNSSSVTQGRAVAASFELYNSLDIANNLASVNQWRLSNESEGICGEGGSVGTQMGPFRIVVLSGFYGLNNYTLGKPLNIFPFPSCNNCNQTGYNWCNYYVGEAYLGSFYYDFEPLSDVATTTFGTSAISLTVMLKPITYALPLGLYTVIGGDEWSDIQIAHFVVGPDHA